MRKSTCRLLPKTIGDPQYFAVLVDLDEYFGEEWLFGKIGYVIGGIPVGDYEQGTSLRDVLLQMNWIVFDSGTRRTERFLGLPKDELFKILWGHFYVETTEELRSIANEEGWAKHNITLPVDVFDGFKVYQFDEGSTSRLLWMQTTGGDETVREVQVPLGFVEQVFEELRVLLELVTAWEESTRSKENNEDELL